MDVPCEMLLHPELLNNEQLINIIMERHLKVPNIKQMARSDLLELFHQFCVPYGQRKYRDSGRGKLLNQSRRISQDSPPKLNTSFNNESTRKTYFNNCERLKPPPDILSGHMKRIKLENKSKQISSNLNGSVNKRKNTSEDTSMDCTPPQKKERKPITWP